MKILKRTRGTGEVFDTENIESKTKYPHLPPTSKALHHYHKTTDNDFLKQFFPEKHQVFCLFSESYYYVIE
jgi:hypothetical protein